MLMLWVDGPGYTQKEVLRKSGTQRRRDYIFLNLLVQESLGSTHNMIVPESMQYFKAFMNLEPAKSMFCFVTACVSPGMDITVKYKGIPYIRVT
jgi:hypothetical protein